MSAHQIQSDMRELKELAAEVKRLKMTLKLLNLKKREIEDRIKEYLDKNDQPGIKYQSLIVLSTEKKVRKRKTVEERANEVAQILEERGIHDVDDAVLEIMETLKGRAQTTMALKIKDDPNKILKI
jgi:hypothetical protein